MEEMNFYCKIGDIETTTPWGRPSLELLELWYNEWKNTPGLDKYEIYLVGNFAEITWGSSPLETWDVDVVLVSSTIDDNDEMKDIMNEAVRLGFKYFILIDIYHNNKLLDFKNFQPLKQTRGFQHFYKERNGEVFNYYVQGDRVKELPGGLYEISHPHPSKSINKAFDRYKRGEYKGVQMDLREIMKQKKL